MAALDYAYPWDNLIAQFKYRDQPALARVLGRPILARADATELLRRCDSIIPIPISTAKLMRRGYNQSLLLARAVSPAVSLGARIDVEVLIRTENTLNPAQTNQGRSDRLAQMRHAFVVDPTQIHRLGGRHVLLIDDVMTTGATLFSAARVLRQAGAAQVSALVLARTRPDAVSSG